MQAFLTVLAIHPSLVELWIQNRNQKMMVLPTIHLISFLMHISIAGFIKYECCGYVLGLAAYMIF